MNAYSVLVGCVIMALYVVVVAYVFCRHIRKAKRLRIPVSKEFPIEEE